jgi:hypothetical protein
MQNYTIHKFSNINEVHTKNKIHLQYRTILGDIIHRFSSDILFFGWTLKCTLIKADGRSHIKAFQSLYHVSWGTLIYKIILNESRKILFN